MSSKKKHGLTDHQLKALGVMRQFGPMQYINDGSATHYRSVDGTRHSLVAINNLERMGLVSVVTTKKARVATITEKGVGKLGTSLSHESIRRNPHKASVGKRRLTDQECKVLRQVADYGKVFYDDATRTYDGIDVQTLRRMAGYVWVALTTKQFAEILPNGLRALKDGEVAVL